MKLFSALFLTLLFASAVSAETITLQTADEKSDKVTSFNGVGGWSDGNAPAAGNDYLVNLGAEEGDSLFAPSVTANFAGDSLTIGDATNPGRMEMGSTVVKWTIPVLNLVNGKIIARGSPGIKAEIGFLGPRINILSTRANPFVFEQVSGSALQIPTGNLVYGNQDACVIFRSASGTSVYAGSQDQQKGFANYKGQIILDNAFIYSSNFAQFDSPSNYVDRFVLRNGGGFRIRESPKGGWGYPRVGVKVESSGGTLDFSKAGQGSFGLTVRGGPLVNKSSQALVVAGIINTTVFTNQGTSTTTFSKNSKFTTPVLVVNSGVVTFESGAGFVEGANPPVRVTAEVNGGTLAMANATAANFDSISLNGGTFRVTAGSYSSGSAEDIFLTNFTFKSGAVLLDLNATADRVDRLILSDSCKVGFSESNPLVLKSNIQYPIVTATNVYNIFDIPVSCGIVTPTMFDCSLIESDNRLPAEISVDTVDGIQYVKINIKRIVAEDYYLVTPDTDFSENTAFNTLNSWSSGEGIVQYHNYHVTLGTNDNQALHCPAVSCSFPGNKLTIGSKTNPGRMDYATTHVWSFNDLQLVNGKIVYHCGLGSHFNTTTPAGIKGSITVCSQIDNPFVFEAAPNNKTLQYAVYPNALLGDADSAVSFRAPSSSYGTIVNAGAGMQKDGFSSFKGTVILDGIILRIGDFAQFGNMKGFIFKNGGGFRTRSASGGSWSNSKLPVFIEETGGVVVPDTSTISASVPFYGGPLTCIAGASWTYAGKMAVSVFTNNTSTAIMRSGANLFNGRIVNAQGAMQFNDGVTFTNGLSETVITPVDLLTGTIKAGKSSLETFNLNLKGGKLITESDAGVVYENITIPSMEISGCATIRLDSNPNANESDKLVIKELVGCNFSSENPLKLELSSPIPSTGNRRTYEVLEFPKGTRQLYSSDFNVSAITFDNADHDGTYKIVANVKNTPNGTQTVSVKRVYSREGTMLFMR